VALTATIYQFGIELADIDRGVYETLDLRVARQPSETVEYMLTRVLAYCLEYQEGIALTEGVAAGDEPAVIVRDLTGRVTAWIEVGMPDASRVHRGRKLAGRAAVYTHRDIRQVLAQLDDGRVHRAEDVPVYTFEGEFIERLAQHVERRTSLSLSITERQIFVNVGPHTLTTSIEAHRIG
jgi:uncharacterized protein YaeQ